ncbi:hypothetical protein Btru_061837 [Bulinus truncatus]|nr:hypothetical protein Btru_061837 [Bulinus truncatus]
MGYGVNKELQPLQDHANSRTVKGDDSGENRKVNVYRVNVLVPDSCHSWLICLANFVILAFLSSYSRVMYITFLDLVRKFDVSITTASIGFTLQLLSISLMSTLVTSLIVPATGERIACVVASCVGCLATFGIGLSPNIAVYLIMMTIKGACMGILSVPPIAMISKYFVKRKSLATAIACSGLAVGSMGAPPMAEAMLQTYGLYWTYLLTASLEMNNIWASILLRPTSRYKKILGQGASEKGNNPTQDESNNLSELQPLTTYPAQPFCGNQSASENNESWVGDNVDQCQSTEARINDAVKTISDTDGQSDKQTNTVTLDGSGETFTSFHVALVDQSSAKSGHDAVVTENNAALHSLFIDENVHRRESGRDSRELPETTEINEQRITSCDLLGIDPTNSTGCTSGQEESCSQKSIGRHSVTIKTVIWAFLRGFYRAFNLKLLRLWSMRCLLLYCTSGVVIMYVPVYLPIMAVKVGMTADQISLMLIASGGVDFIGRLALGAFSDMKLLTASQIVAITQILMGTVCHFSTYFTTFGTMMILAVSNGLFAGSRIGLATIICYEYMGPTNLLRSFGVQTTLATLSMGVHHPLLSRLTPLLGSGSILEATGSFAPPLHYVGTTAYISAIFLLLQPLAKRLDSHRPEMKEIT